jgi:hypothetical protein
VECREICSKLSNWGQTKTYFLFWILICESLNLWRRWCRSVSIKIRVCTYFVIHKFTVWLNSNLANRSVTVYTATGTFGWWHWHSGTIAWATTFHIWWSHCIHVSRVSKHSTKSLVSLTHREYILAIKVHGIHSTITLSYSDTSHKMVPFHYRLTGCCTNVGFVQSLCSVKKSGPVGYIEENGNWITITSPDIFQIWKCFLIISLV